MDAAFSGETVASRARTAVSVTAFLSGGPTPAFLVQITRFTGRPGPGELSLLFTTCLNTPPDQSNQMNNSLFERFRALNTQPDSRNGSKRQV